MHGNHCQQNPDGTFYRTMSDIPYYLIERFPKKGEAIAFRMAKDARFLAICEDYGVCLKAYRYWKRSREPEAGARVSEYLDLIQLLEAEIEEALLDPQPEPLGL